MTDTITLPRSVVEQALEAFDESYADTRQGRALADALRAALEQQQGEQEPVAMLSIEVIGPRTKVDVEWNDPLYQLPSGNYKLYTRQQPKRERLPVGAELFIRPQNLRCKSNQARLATLWGYVKPQPQVEQEPVAWMWEFKYDKGAAFSTKKPNIAISDGVEYVPLYTHPQPKRDELLEALKGMIEVADFHQLYGRRTDAARAAIAKATGETK